LGIVEILLLEGASPIDGVRQIHNAALLVKLSTWPLERVMLLPQASLEISMCGVRITTGNVRMIRVRLCWPRRRELEAR
jgi:hypothetical protein